MGLYFILPVPNIYTIERYSVKSQLSSTYSAHHAQHIGTKSMHIKNATNSQLSLTHLAQLAAYRIYSVDRYIPY